MKEIEVSIHIGLVGCNRTTTFEIGDDATPDEIEEQAREAMFEMLEWHWTVLREEEEIHD